MTPQLLIITDTETTGLDPKTEKTIEVAAVLFSVEHGCVVEAFSSLIRASSNDAEAINRISPAALSTAPHPDYVWGHVAAMVGGLRGPACFLAHRAEFDRSFYPPTLASKLPWICSKFECEFPRSKVGASLVEVALAHDVPVHANHRALTDCLLLSKVLERVKDTLPAILERAMRPQATFRVTDTNFDEARNALAKAASFQWQKPHWVRRMAIADIGSLPFAVTQVSV